MSISRAMGSPPWVTAVFLVTTALGVASGCKRENKLLPRGEGAAVLVVGRDKGPSTEAVADEVEPNSNAIEAQNVTLPRGGLTVRGTLTLPEDGKGHDTDTFDFVFPAHAPKDVSGVIVVDPEQAADAVPPAPSRWRLEISAVVLNPLPDGESGEGESGKPPSRSIRLDYGDPTGKVGIRAPAADGIAVIPNATGDAGDKAFVSLVGLRSKNDSPVHLKYQIEWHLTPLEPGAEEEINGTQPLATTIAPGLNIEAVGFLGWRADTDWYAIDRSAWLSDGRVRVDMDLPQGAIAWVAVFDAAGKQWAATAPGREQIWLRDVAFPPASTADGIPEPLYVVVQNTGPPVTDARYILRVASDLPESDRETEPNNLGVQALALQPGVVRRGTLPPGDEDFWIVPAAPIGANALARKARVDPPPDVPVMVALQRADGSPEGEPIVASGPTELTIPDGGIFLIQLRGKTHNHMKTRSDYLVELVQ